MSSYGKKIDTKEKGINLGNIKNICNLIHIDKNQCKNA